MDKVGQGRYVSSIMLAVQVVLLARSVVGVPMPVSYT
jgi:hypothetical protein